MSKISVRPQDIILFHVGGSMGNYGPIDSIIHKFPRNCVVVGFEARQDESDKEVDTSLTPLGVRLHLVNAFIGEKDGHVQDFYINKHPENSSGLPPNPQVLEEICPVPYADDKPTWGVNTALDRKETVTTKSLKTVIKELGVTPDVLSIDAQGLEVAILKGTGNYLKDAVALVTEVEFFEIYAGQGLFADQAILLKKRDFRLAELLNSQNWYPGVSCGKGYLTVSEALWFKQLDAFFTESKNDQDSMLRGIKFAAVAFCFEYYSTAYLIIERLMANNSASAVEKCCIDHDYGILLSVHSQVNKLQEDEHERWRLASKTQVS